MNSLHTHSPLSAPYELPVFSCPAEQPYGLMFGECKAGASIHFERDVPFHLLFLLKGAGSVKLAGKEIDIFQQEFLMVDSALPVESECICVHHSHYVLICLDKAFPADMVTPTQRTDRQPQTIPETLSVLLRYMLPTMPLNEKLNHYMIPRIIGSIIRGTAIT